VRLGVDVLELVGVVLGDVSFRIDEYLGRWIVMKQGDLLGGRTARAHRCTTPCSADYNLHR